ncbi:hypothetical protein [Salinibacter ruber]|uniref:hypothetical protein n=1 Tax=Salinibacter ruber TaxID=146919 RepID=UPI000E6D22E5|nr:hypothetical protein [Salinibacter ruber]
MSQLEYLVALVSIIVGLGLTDLAQSVRELIRPGYAVKWDGLPLAWSAFVFLFTILLWWNGFSVLESASSAGEAGPRFLSYLLFFFLLYLCCAFALPDPDWETSVAGSGDGSAPAVDLEAFYFSAGHRRWFFGLLTGLFVALGVDNQISFAWGSMQDRLVSALAIGGLATASAVPMVTDQRWAHWTAVAMTLGLIGWRAARQILF